MSPYPKLCPRHPYGATWICWLSRPLTFPTLIHPPFPTLCADPTQPAFTWDSGETGFSLHRLVVVLMMAQLTPEVA